VASNPKAKSTDELSLLVGCYHPGPPSPFIVITQPESAEDSGVEPVSLAVVEVTFKWLGQVEHIDDINWIKPFQ